jgi:hypothetical protein
VWKHFDEIVRNPAQFSSVQFFTMVYEFRYWTQKIVCLYCWFRAPVKSVVYDTPYTRVTQADINLVVELYRTDLEVIHYNGMIFMIIITIIMHNNHNKNKA